MSCVLCDSWAHCPVNPKTLHPRPRAATERDVEVALLTGYTWGTHHTKNGLCDDHRAMLEEMKAKLGIP